MDNTKGVIYFLRVFGVSMLLGTITLGCYMTSHYQSHSTVYEVTNNEVTFESEGELYVWELEDGEDYSIGEAVTLTLDTHNTNNTRLDDEIDSIRK